MRKEKPFAFPLSKPRRSTPVSRSSGKRNPAPGKPKVILVPSIENQELKSQLESCIDALPEKYAMVFRMKTIQEFETEEICKELDITASNLWVIIHRARTQLRKCMEDNWFNI